MSFTHLYHNSCFKQSFFQGELDLDLELMDGDLIGELDLELSDPDLRELLDL